MRTSPILITLAMLAAPATAFAQQQEGGLIDEVPNLSDPAAVARMAQRIKPARARLPAPVIVQPAVRPQGAPFTGTLTQQGTVGGTQGVNVYRPQ